LGEGDDLEVRFEQPVLRKIYGHTDRYPTTRISYSALQHVRVSLTAGRSEPKLKPGFAASSMHYLA
jgi:hypothetical protein